MPWVFDGVGTLSAGGPPQAGYVPLLARHAAETQSYDSASPSSSSTSTGTARGILNGDSARADRRSHSASQEERRRFSDTRKLGERQNRPVPSVTSAVSPQSRSSGSFPRGNAMTDYPDPHDRDDRTILPTFSVSAILQSLAPAVLGSAVTSQSGSTSQSPAKLTQTDSLPGPVGAEALFNDLMDGADARVLKEKTDMYTGALIIGLTIGGLLFVAVCLWTQRWASMNLKPESNKDLYFALQSKLESMAALHRTAIGKSGPLVHPSLESLDDSVWETRVVDEYRNSGKVTLPPGEVEYDEKMRPIVSKKSSGHYRFSLCFSMGPEVNITGIAYDESDGTSQLAGFYEETTGVMIFEEKFERTENGQPIKAMVEMLVLGHVGQRRSLKGKVVPASKFHPCVVVGLDISENADPSLPTPVTEMTVFAPTKKSKRVPPKASAGIMRKMTQQFGISVREKGTSPEPIKNKGPPAKKGGPAGGGLVRAMTRGFRKTAPEPEPEIYDPRNSAWIEHVKNQETSAVKVQSALRGRLARKKTSPILAEKRKKAARAAGRGPGSQD